MRERLQANPWAQIGASAIAWEPRKLPEGLVYEYVTAVPDIGREELDVVHLGRRVKTLPFRLGD